MHRTASLVLVLALAAVSRADEVKRADEVIPLGDRLDVQNDLRSIGQFYKLFQAERNRSPRVLAEFSEYLRKDAPAIHKKIADGYYQIVLNAKQTENGIVAYTKGKSTGGNHYIARADATVAELSPDDLKKEVKLP